MKTEGEPWTPRVRRTYRFVVRVQQRRSGPKRKDFLVRMETRSCRS